MGPQSSAILIAIPRRTDGPVAGGGSASPRGLRGAAARTTEPPVEPPVQAPGTALPVPSLQPPLP